MRTRNQHTIWRAAIFILWVALSMGIAPGVLAHTVTRPVTTLANFERAEGYREVVDKLRAWDLDAAEQMVTELRKKSPGLAEWDALDGAIAYLHGDFERSLAYLNAALKKRSGDGEWLELRLHVRQSQSAVEGFVLHRTPHFDIWYEPKVDAILLPYLEEPLEKAYRILGKELGVKPKRRIRVEVFSDPERFHKASTLSRSDIEEKGAVGVCKFNKVMILSPGALLRGYRWLDTAAHEYVHYLIVLGTKNRTPIWLHEGMAKYLEKRWRSPEEDNYLHPGERALLDHARKTNVFIPFQRMEPSLIYLDSPHDVQLAYAEAASAADFIHRKARPKGLAKVLRAIGEAPEVVAKKDKDKEKKSEGPEDRASLVELEAAGPEQSAEPGLKKLFGIGLTEFEKQWKEDLKHAHLQVSAGAAVPQPRLKPSGPVEESDVDLAELKSAVARRRTRLGDRLSVRGRLRAALVEYRRALRDEPHSEVLLNRTARVELQLGRIAEAQRLLEKAVAVDPDYATTHVHRAMAFELEGKPDAARRAWEEVIQINPFVSLAHVRLAVLYERAGKAKKAEREREIMRELRRTQ